MIATGGFMGLAEGIIDNTYFELLILVIYTCPSNSVNVADCRRREIVIDHKIDAFEINAPAKKFSADQNPNSSSSKIFDSIVSLQFGFVGMDRIHADIVFFRKYFM